MKKLLTLFPILFLAMTVRAQSLEPFVVASAGDFFVNTGANASLSFTVGEMAMVETFTNQNHILTQGFQQPEMSLTALEDENFVYEFVVYPNPANEFLNVRYKLRYPGELSLRLVDGNGVQVFETYSHRYSGGLRTDRFDLDQLSQGLYFLQVGYRVPSKNIEHVSHYKINVIKF